MNLRGTANLTALFSGFRDQFDLEYAGPQFTGHEQTFAICVVGDSVQHGARRDVIDRAQKTLEVDPADYFAALGRDACDPIGLPYVRENLSLDKLQFV